MLLKLQEERSIGMRAVFRELSKLSGSTFAFKRYSFHFHGTLRPKSQSQITRAENVPLQIYQPTKLIGDGAHTIPVYLEVTDPLSKHFL